MTRMIKITQTFLIDVKAPDAASAKQIAHNKLYDGLIDLEDPTSYSVEDCGEGSWDE